jgi:hypothetical protein
MIAALMQALRAIVLSVAKAACPNYLMLKSNALSRVSAIPLARKSSSSLSRPGDSPRNGPAFVYYHKCIKRCGRLLRGPRFFGLPTPRGSTSWRTIDHQPASSTIAFRPVPGGIVIAPMVNGVALLGVGGD